MKSLASHLNHFYQLYHHAIARWTHYLGVLLIMFAALIPLGWIHITIPTYLDSSLAWLALFGLIVYYFFKDPVLATPTALVLLGLGLIAHFIAQAQPSRQSAELFIGTLLLGAILLILEWLFVRKMPRRQDFWQGLLSPLCLAAEIAFMLGYKQKLREKAKIPE